MTDATLIKRPEKVTITTIARRLGVSHQTVSNVLSGQAQKRKVAEATAVRVQNAATRMGYLPNHMARSLKNNKTGMISTLFISLNLGWAEQAVLSIEDVLDQAGYLTTISIYGRCPVYSNGNPLAEARKIEKILQRRDEGVICQPSPYYRSGYETLQKWRIPTVFIGSLLEDMIGLENVSYVIWDCGPAVKTAVQYLIKTGRRRIAFIGGRHQLTSDAVRFDAFKEVMDDAGFQVKPEWTVWDPITTRVTDDLIKPLFAGNGERPDAIFAINDGYALFILDVLKRLHINVPDDVAVIGMGNLPAAAGCDVTTVREPLDEIGRASAQAILELIKNPDQDPIHLKIHNNELFIRNTA